MKNARNLHSRDKVPTLLQFSVATKAEHFRNESGTFGEKFSLFLGITLEIAVLFKENRKKFQFYCNTDPL